MQTSARASAACIAGAVILNILPWFGGPGLIWSVLLLGGAGWVLSGRATQRHLVLWTLLACAHALDNFYIGIGTLPWLAGAIFSIWAVWSLFDTSKFKHGYAPYAIVGALLCLWTPFWTWGDVPGWIGWTWTGGLDLNTRMSAGGNSSAGIDTNVMRWILPIYYPGWDYTGRALAGSFNASLIALASLGWTLWRDEDNRHRTRILPVVGALFLMVWVFPALRTAYIGPKVFLLGALGLGVCALMALRGRQSGAFDANDVAGRVKAEVDKRTAPR